jgi:hypothetical protein
MGLSAILVYIGIFWVNSYCCGIILNGFIMLPFTLIGQSAVILRLEKIRLYLCRLSKI